ncbi:MAG TPA: hypothetical protein VKS82_18865 [Streptosporangiaceae bacterium]|nr:hypothetical protein [Streptosporangiaceae bacterium]
MTARLVPGVMATGPESVTGLLRGPENVTGGRAGTRGAVPRPGSWSTGEVAERATPPTWPVMPPVRRPEPSERTGPEVTDVATPATREASAVTGSSARHPAARFWIPAPTPAAPGKLGAARSVDAGWSESCR